MKHMKLIAVLAAAMMVPAASAGPKMDKAKDLVKVGFHLSKVVTGWNVGAVGWSKGIGQDEGQWLVGGSLCLIVDGLHDLKNDLHQHIFHHMNAWYKRVHNNPAKGQELECGG